MAWNLTGTYFETCSCEFICPCTASLAHGADYDRCSVTLIFSITEGQVEGTDIGGLKVTAIADTPKVMTEGNWRLGVFVDENASDEQTEKLLGVFSGTLGGPMAALSPLVGENLGVERAAIEVHEEGLRHSVRIGGAGLAPAFAAARARLGLIALLFVLAGLAWWSTVDRMRGMDGGPGTSLGTLGWFLGVWTVMMTAMMLPSVSPTVALFARMTRERSPVAPLVFTSGYLLVWAGAGILAFGVSGLGGRLLGDTLAWDRAGRWIAGGILIAAAAYEVTALKNVCLSKCRSPLGFLLGSWRDGL